MDDDDSLFSNLFQNESYEEQAIEVTPGVTLRLLVSPSASTDYDLTGQVIWPGARLLSQYLCSRPQTDIQRWDSACELGSGLGLAGLVTARFLPTVLTDHSPIVLKVLQKNAALNPGGHPVRCMLLDWGNMEHIQHALEVSPQQQGYGLIVAADCCYNLSAIPKLFETAATLLRKDRQACMLLGYVSRSANLDKAVPEAARAKGFDITAVELTRQQVSSGLWGWVRQVKWNLGS
jgi:predicted nicotinamide N-methyase